MELPYQSLKSDKSKTENRPNAIKLGYNVVLIERPFLSRNASEKAALTMRVNLIKADRLGFDHPMAKLVTFCS